jgi:arginase
MKSSINIIFNCSEIGAGTRGSSLGPNAILTAARTLDSALFQQYRPIYVEDFNSELENDTPYRWAKRIDVMTKVYDKIASTVKDTLNHHIYPLVLAGDHCSAGGTIRGIHQAFPEKRIGVVWIDAHADLHTPFTTPSGNLHGMPLATALGFNNRQCANNELEVETEHLWSELKTGCLKPEDLIFIGVRDTEKEEDAIIERHQIRNFTVQEVNELGTANICQQIAHKLNECDIIYVSFDVDSMDPDFTSYGTGTPVKNGLTFEQAEDFLNYFAALDKVLCMEFVEVNPCLDNKKNKMAELTLTLMEQVVEKLENKKWNK